MSQLALSSQNKFFLKSPPKSRKNPTEGSPHADLNGAASEGSSPTGQYENCLSAGLDFAICDLVSLDSQAEVDQGICLREGTSEAAVLFYSLSSQKVDAALSESLFSPLVFSQRFTHKDLSQLFLSRPH